MSAFCTQEEKMALKGKGFYIFQIPECEGGNPQAIASLAQAAGLGHVLVKIADGASPFGQGVTAPVVEALKDVGIPVWGWHFVYGNDPAGEAQVAIDRTLALGLDGYVIDAEDQYKHKPQAARSFMTALRAGLPETEIALSSFRFPNFHQELPWNEFLEKCDYNMPQVYWVESHNPAQQLQWSKQQFEALPIQRTFIPTGAAYSDNPGDWKPTESDVIEFLNAARGMGFEAANFFSWDYCRKFLPKLWKAIAEFEWPLPVQPQPPVDFVPDYLAALNAHSIERIMKLYNEDAVLVTYDRILRGLESIRTWYGQYFSELLPNGQFEFTQIQSDEDVRHITWKATSEAGSVRAGYDTVVLRGNKASVHYSYFNIR
jgi:hypothetical protein